MTTTVFVLLFTAIHENTKPKAKSECATADRYSTTLQYTKPSTSGTHAESHQPQSVDDRLDGYPLGVDSYKEENIVATKFYRDLRYMTLDHDADYLWEEHLHMITGNIKLPPAEENGNASLKAIAMFHQMHCLAAMRSVIQRAREGEDVGKDWTDDLHWPHCFDYLRMSILCFADSTLESLTVEPGPIDDGKVIRVIDGGADERYCRNANPLYVLERRYGPNSQYGFSANHGS
ncbi:hypothetical protein K504DRAFT_376102 [Pleomassaria siparia CBS 279.74]|uniref:Uncharacterized protein n=1 Tax=Pleomassaria siparia CBS 279.74 TaxID=1314801 RepID=A0A6G1KD64_9PLEO|nr:hypothetical protein K504DRAFT_376102 [Pleomassaria siparia CBS 279.74]